MKAICRPVMFTVVFAAMCSAWAVNFPAATGDIASNGADGWNGTMPSVSEIATFNTVGGVYTAGADVTLGSVRINQNTTFNLDTSGNHVIRTSKFYFGWYNRTVNIKGGVWDMSGTLSSDTAAPDHAFMACNANGVVYNTVATLSNGCVVTNATSIRVGHSTNKNQLKITDGSRIYVNGSANLWINNTGMNGLLELSSGGRLSVSGTLNDGLAGNSSAQIRADTTNSIVVTGNGSKLSSTRFYIGNAYGRNSLLVSDGGELLASEKFGVGNSANANTNRAVFETGAKFQIRDIRVGENGSCGNVLEILSGAIGTIDAGGRVGGWTTAGSDNTIIVSNATVSVTGTLGFGSPSGDASGISGNGLIVRGNAPLLAITSNLLVKNRSFLRIEVPAGGYAGDFTPLSADTATIDGTSSLDVVLAGVDGFPDRQRLISTSNGITIPDEVLASAKAAVYAQSNGRARLVKADDGNAIDLKVVKGLIVSFK